MSNAIRERTVAAFLHAVAAREPAPGGGAVAAVTAAAAAGLVAMAARFTTGELADLDERADQLRAQALRLADADGLVFKAVLEAYQLPRDLPERKERLIDALRSATEVPLEIARVGSETAQLAARLAAGGNPHLLGDARGAALLAEGATRTAAGLVRLNATQGGLEDIWFTAAEEYEQTAREASDAATGGAHADGGGLGKARRNQRTTIKENR